MKPVIVFVGAFVVATAASAGAKIAITPPPAPKGPMTHADSLKADSLKANGEHADSTKASGDSAMKSATDTAVVASGQPAALPVENPAKADSSAKAAARVTQLEQAVNQATAAAAASDTVTAASERRIAKVFTSMDAKQAAKVLEHMADSDVHVILGYVGVKQAAQIMAALPPERVAKLSKLAMGSK